MRTKIKDLTLLATCVGHINFEKLDFEWKILPSIYNDAQKDQFAFLELAICGNKYLNLKILAGNHFFQI